MLISWSMYAFALCAMIDSLTLSSQPAALSFVPGETYPTHGLSIMHSTAFLSLGTLQILRHYTWGPKHEFLNRKVISEVLKNVKSMTVRRPQKDTYLQMWVKMTGQTIALCDLSRTCICQVPHFFSALCVSRNDLKTPWVLIWGLQINFSK